MDSKAFIPYSVRSLTEEQQLQNVREFYEFMNTRRSVRQFSNKAISKDLIENIIQTASTAPSGAHKQPWTFCAVSNPTIKQKIREAAEKEEFENYNGRMSEEWKKDLEKFETNWVKEFLTTAPWLIVLFKKSYDQLPDGKKSKNYYVQESVGIAAGLLLTAIHNAGLVTLTHTPSPMTFLQEILKRPENEKPFLLLPVGYPSAECMVPVLIRKSMSEVVQYYE